MRCSTITTATMRGGTESRPVVAKRSANTSSGNRLWHSRYSRA